MCKIDACVKIDSGREAKNSIYTLFFALALVISIPSRAQEIGLVAYGVYYSVNPALHAGTSVQVLPDDGSAAVRCCAEISGSAKKSGAQIFDSLLDRQISAYALSLPQSIPTDSVGFGIVGPAQVVQHGTRPEVVLSNGMRLELSTCMSPEAAHYLGREVTGDKKLLFHMYQYFDFTFEPTCKNSDLASGALPTNVVPRR